MANREPKITGVIRHRDTQQYYTGAGAWSSMLTDAMQFENLSAVMAEASRYGIVDCCEFMISLPDSGAVISLPL